jgi:hypothetical protein
MAHPIVKFIKDEEINSALLKKHILTILSNLLKTAHPVVYNVLHVVKSQVIPVCLNDLFDFIIRVSSRFQNSFQKTKKPKTTRVYVWWITVGAAILKDGGYHISTLPLIHYDPLDFDMHSTLWWSLLIMKNQIGWAKIRKNVSYHTLLIKSAALLSNI